MILGVELIYVKFTSYMSLGHKPKLNMPGTTLFTVAGLRNEACKIIHNCSYSDTQMYVSKCILCFTKVYNDHSWWLSLRAIGAL